MKALGPRQVVHKAWNGPEDLIWVSRGLERLLKPSEGLLSPKGSIPGADR